MVSARFCSFIQTVSHWHAHWRNDICRDGALSFTTLLLGRFGSEVVAAHNISMNINGVLFMPPMALGMAATIRIGYRIGQGEPRCERNRAYCHGRNAPDCADWCSHDFRPESSARRALHDRDRCRDSGSRTTAIRCVFSAFRCCPIHCRGVLRGYKDTQIPMRIALLSYWVIGLPVGCALGYGWFFPPMEVYGFWIGLAAGVGSAAILLGLRTAPRIEK